MRMFRVSMYEMKRSENVCSSRSSWIIASFSMVNTLLGDDGRGRPDAKRLTGQRAFTEEVAWTQHRDDRLFADLGQYRELDRTLLDVFDVLARIALREDDISPLVLHHFSRGACRRKIFLHVERASRLRLDGSCLSLDEGHGSNYRT